jgi:DNA-binding MarR family transcriptional regulator
MQPATLERTKSIRKRAMKPKKSQKPKRIPGKVSARPATDVIGLLPLYNKGNRSYFGYRMVVAAKMFDRVVSKLLAQHGEVSLPQWRVITQLGVTTTGTVRSLADGAAVDRAEMSRATRELLRRGLLNRREDPTDKRSPQFTLTPSGRKLYRRVRKPIHEFISHLMADVSDRDLAAADRVLWQVTCGCNNVT